MVPSACDLVNNPAEGRCFGFWPYRLIGGVFCRWLCAAPATKPPVSAHNLTSKMAGQPHKGKATRLVRWDLILDLVCFLFGSSFHPLAMRFNRTTKWYRYCLPAGKLLILCRTWRLSPVFWLTKFKQSWIIVLLPQRHFLLKLEKVEKSGGGVNGKEKDERWKLSFSPPPPKLDIKYPSPSPHPIPGPLFPLFHPYSAFSRFCSCTKSWGI